MRSRKRYVAASERCISEMGKGSMTGNGMALDEFAGAWPGAEFASRPDEAFSK